MIVTKIHDTIQDASLLANHDVGRPMIIIRCHTLQVRSLQNFCGSIVVYHDFDKRILSRDNIHACCIDGIC